MNRKSAFSALLAVVMVLSMLTVIALPVHAVTSAIPTLSAQQVAALPSVQTATMDDGVQAYKIETVDDLIYAAAAERYSSSQSYRDESSAESNADYEATYFNIAAISGQRNRSRYVNPTYIDRATFVWNDRTTYNHLYLAADLDIPAWETATGKSFAAEYDNFMGGARAASYYDTVYANICGMGHTITGFNDEHPFAIYWAGEVKNLTLVNPTVDETVSAAPIGYSAVFFRGAEEGGVTLNNVDITSATFKPNSTAMGGIYFGMASNGNRPVKMYDCDLLGSKIITTVADSQYGGLIAGLVASPASGMPSDCSTLENITVLNSSIEATDLSGINSALLVGRVDKGSGTLGLRVNNVAVSGCSLVLGSTDGALTLPVIADVYRIHPDSNTDIGNVYVRDTNVTYPNAEGTGTVTEPMNALFRAQNNLLTNHAAAADGVAITDAATVLIARTDDATASIPAKVVADNLEYPAIMSLMSGNKYVVFEDEESTLLFVADSNGVVTIDATNKAALSAKSWTVDGTPATINFDNLVVAANTVYSVAAHTNHIEAIPGDNANHKVVCDNCNDAEHNYTVACADVTVDGTPVAGDYYTASKTAYTCVCGNTWSVDDANYAPEAPITVTFDADSYTGTGAAVKVALGAKADANLNAYTATVTFDPAKLAYVDYSTAFNCVVDDTDKANGVVTVAFVQAGGQILNAEAMTLNFQTVNVTADGTVGVNVAVTEAVVDTGSETVNKMPLNTQAADSAAVVYVPSVPAPVFTAGDVNNDSAINLLDAVLTVQHVSGTMYAGQAATFEPWAANVDGDTAISVNDVTLLLKKAVNMPVDLVASTVQPTVVAPNP